MSQSQTLLTSAISPYVAATTKRAISDRQFLIIATLAVAMICIAALFVTGEAGKGSGAEMSTIAEHLVSGRGYASPYLPAEQTAPTTVSPPLYVWIMAGVYDLFGIKTFTSRLLMQLFNITIHCCTLVVLFHFCRRSFSSQAARMFAVLYGIHPHLIYLPSNVWETNLTTLFLSLILYFATFHVAHFRTRGLLLFGVLLGVTSLSNPAWTISYPFICLLPFLLHPARPGAARVLKSLTFITVAFVLVVSPWVYRNYQVTGDFIFVRGMTGPEWFKGNNEFAGGGHGDGFVRYYLLAKVAEPEREKLAALGEQTYNAQTMQAARDFIVENPGQFAWLTAKRILMWWTGDLDVTQWYYQQRNASFLTESGSSHYFLLGLLLTVSGAITSLFALAGLLRVKSPRRQLWGLYTYLILLPLPFYLIVAGFRYQSALMPFTLIPASYAAMLLLGWIHARIARSALEMQGQ